MDLILNWETVTTRGQEWLEITHINKMPMKQLKLNKRPLKFKVLKLGRIQQKLEQGP